MSSGEIARYVVTVKIHEDSLTELNEINNHLTRGGFLLTMTDEDGTLHELGTRPRYWEGAVDVSGSHEGHATSGRGYVELVGY